MRLLSKMSIGRKLAAGVLFLLAAVAGLGYFAARTVSVLGGALEVAVNTRSRGIESAGALRSDFQQMAAASRAAQIAMVIELLGAARANSGRAADAGAQCAGCHDAGTAETAVAALREAAGNARTRVAALRRLADSEEERRALEVTESRLGLWLSAFEQYRGLARAGDYTQAHEVLSGRIQPAREELEKATDVVMGHQRELLKVSGQEAAQQVSRSRWFSLALIALCLGVGAAVLVSVRRASRDLSGLGKDLAGDAQDVAAAAETLAGLGQTLAGGASEQVARLQQAAATGNSVDRMAAGHAKLSDEVLGVMRSSQQKLVETRQALGHMETAMREISSSSDRIGQILRVIHEIAFQTNILALNAAIEAARAGQAGAGFAVVADEVRGLAQRCAQAAQDTEKLVAESVQRSHQGQAKVEQVNQVVGALAEDTNRIQSLLEQVHHGSGEQAQGMREIDQAIGAVGEVAHRTAAAAEESASAAEQLSERSAALEQAVERLTSLVGAER